MKKIAIVTGASSGIGREFALQLDKEEGFDEFWLIARRREKLEQRLEKQNPEGARRLRQWERELRWKKEENETI